MSNKIAGGNLKRAGRPKGSPNKVSAEAKDAIAQAAANLGGHERLVDWVKEDPKNEAAFWTTIYPKLIAVTLNASIAASLVIKTGVPRANGD